MYACLLACVAACIFVYLCVHVLMYKCVYVFCDVRISATYVSCMCVCVYYRKKTASSIVIGKPTNLVHKSHVGTDGTQWSSERNSADLLKLVDVRNLCI